MDLETLSETIDGLVATLARDGAQRWADAESIVALHRQLARLDAVVTMATAAFEAAREWEVDGAQTAAAWVATRCRVPKGVARRTVRVGRALRHLPVCEQAWLAGDLTACHVRTIAAVRRPATEAALARDEHLLVGHARAVGFEAFTKAVAYWDQLADPDGADDDDETRRARRDVYLDRSFAGMWFGRITLDPISGAIVGGELARLERHLFDADWADAKARLGTDPTLSDLARTPGQRRADALVEMATRSRTAPAAGRRPAPLLSVYVGYETLHGRICELADGTVISPASLLAWLDQAYIERAVFAPDGRVEVSHTARLFTGATRRAIELRDRHCTHPYCDKAAVDCQGDHIIAYADHGPTTQDNGTLRCGYHNRLRQTRGP